MARKARPPRYLGGTASATIIEFTLLHCPISTTTFWWQVRRSRSIGLVLMVVAILTGCLSSDPTRFESKVRDWVPLGTPVTDALRIMQRHGFECHLITTNNPFNSVGLDYLDREKERVRLHDWYARLILQGGKVSAYGPIKTN